MTDVATATCICGREIERQGLPLSGRGGFWQHTTGDPDFCYEEERGMDSESRCTAQPDDDYEQGEREEAG